MAPDLNPSIAPSHGHHPSQPADSLSISNSPAASRRVSLVMGPPPIPGHAASAAPSTHGGAAETSDAGIGPGPLRHPRPMTAADLHLLLEKEQEAVVNRLTRELTMLRQQTASVASTASTTSTGLNDSLDGSSHPASSRHRSSSSLSGHIPPGSAALAASVSSIAPSRDAALPTSRPSGEYTRVARSREPSVTSPRQPVSPYGDHALQSQGPHRSSVSLSHSHSHSHTHLPDVYRSASNASTAGSRYEETAQHRIELEAVKRENEMLRRRVRELEQSLRTYRDAEPHDETPAHTPSLVAGMRDSSIKDS